MAFVLFLLIFVNSGFTNPNRVPTFESNQIHGNGTLYKGTINNNLKIVMYLEFGAEDPTYRRTPVEGWYYYESQGEGKKIKLTGVFGSGQLMLTEGGSTGSFLLNFDGDDGMGGTWSGGGKSFPVSLKESK